MKLAAIKDIDLMLSKRIPMEEIKLRITTRYAYSGKIVDDRIRQHIDAKNAVKKRGKS